jgi:hypothetical protein
MSQFHFLGLGNPAPRPSGEPDPQLRETFLAESQKSMFRFGVTLWWKFIGHPDRNWHIIRNQLMSAEYKRFRSWPEALQSLGWAGLSESGDWLFGVLGHRLPIYGQQSVRHELFHAVQDHTYRLFRITNTVRGVVAAEFAAHTFGSPLIGVPLLYGGIGFIMLKTYQFADLLFGG